MPEPMSDEWTPLGQPMSDERRRKLIDDANRGDRSRWVYVDELAEAMREIDRQDELVVAAGRLVASTVAENEGLRKIEEAARRMHRHFAAHYKGPNLDALREALAAAALPGVPGVCLCGHDREVHEDGEGTCIRVCRCRRFAASGVEPGHEPKHEPALTNRDRLLRSEALRRYCRLPTTARDSEVPDA